MRGADDQVRATFLSVVDDSVTRMAFVDERAKRNTLERGFFNQRGQIMFRRSAYFYKKRRIIQRDVVAVGDEVVGMNDVHQRQLSIEPFGKPDSVLERGARIV